MPPKVGPECERCGRPERDRPDLVQTLAHVVVAAPLYVSCLAADKSFTHIGEARTLSLSGRHICSQVADAVSAVLSVLGSSVPHPVAERGGPALPSVVASAGSVSLRTHSRPYQRPAKGDYPHPVLPQVAALQRSNPSRSCLFYSCQVRIAARA